MLYRDLCLNPSGLPTKSVCTAAAAAAACDVILSSGLNPVAARNAFLEVQRYDAGIVKDAMPPTPAAVRAARVWRETYKVATEPSQVYESPALAKSRKLSSENAVCSE